MLPNALSPTTTPARPKYGPGSPVARQLTENAVATGSAAASALSNDVYEALNGTYRAAATFAAVEQPSASLFASIKQRLGGLGTKANEWLYQGIALFTGGSDTAFTTREVLPTPDDVAYDSAARSERLKHVGAEKAARAQLTSAQQATYDQLVGTLGSNEVARLGLQQMLIDGRLSAPSTLGDRAALVDQLARIADQPLADGINRAELLQHLVIECADPVSIAQRAKGTCGATTAQILLARKHPAEYARLIAGLAAPDGQARMAGGKTLVRPSDWNSDTDGGRSVTCRLFQPAAMDAAEGFGMGYSNTADKSVIGPLHIMGGLTDAAEARLDTQLEGDHYKAHGFYAYNHTAQWKGVKDALKRGAGPVPVSLIWKTEGAPGGHFVQVDAVADGKVSYTNPWGQRETMSEAEFSAHVTGAEYVG